MMRKNISIKHSTITEFYNEIQKLSTLAPNKKTNTLFSNLCHVTQQKYNKSIPLKESRYIRKAAAEAEFLLEIETTTKIIAATDPYDRLQSFIYYQNYVDLTYMEYTHLQLLQKDHKHILFIGGGALPLTAIILAKDYGCQVTVIDKNKKASKLATELIKKLGLEDKITIIHNNIHNFHTTIHFDCVIAAALLFNTQQRKILTSIKKIGSKCYIFRSADGLKRLLYQNLSESIISEYFNIQYVLHPRNHIINSLILAY